MAAASSSTSNSPLTSTFSEDKWFDQINDILKDESPLDLNIPVAVCQIPNSITDENPKAYTPQMISLGPYHYLQPELYQMERYKIETVKSYWNPKQISLVVNRIKEIASTVRACYHKYLDMNDDTLALVIAIDGLFLVYLLSKDLNRFSDDARVFSDVMMLENQIPLILLKEIVKTIGLPDHDDAKVLFSMMWAFCESQSPFELQLNSQDLEEGKVLHLLDLLHKMITMHESNDGNDFQDQSLHDDASQVIELSQQAPVTLNIDPDNDQLVQNGRDTLSNDVLSSIKPIRFDSDLPWDMISNLLSQSSGLKQAATKTPLVEENIDIPSISKHPRMTSIKPIRFDSDLPWDMISNLRSQSSNLKQVATKNPLVEETAIPSVSKLSRMTGITFEPMKNGNMKTLFVTEAATLYVPTIALNQNSEVILRNLLVYEMASSSKTSGYESQKLAQYIDLMSGIINTNEDAYLLQRAGIIKGDLTDSQVANLFNGMKKMSRKVNNDTAARINTYYGQISKVKVYGFVKKYVLKSWRILTIVCTVILLLQMTLQSFCSVYGCKGVVNISPNRGFPTYQGNITNHGKLS